jgi:hypothetical protein
MMIKTRILFGLILTSNPAIANEVSIENVRVECPNTCTFSVTLKHDDEGWSHYADQWDVLTPDGQLLKSRVLYHPHVDEQPFTRSLAGVVIPSKIKSVLIRAKDSKHGFSEKTYRVDLPR